MSDITFDKTRRANKKIGQQLLQALKGPVNKQIETARTLAQKQAQTLLHTSREHMQAALNSEMTRLQELQKQNPAIRDSEIDFIKTQVDALSSAFDNAEVQLDALRIVVNNP